MRTQFLILLLVAALLASCSSKPVPVTQPVPPGQKLSKEELNDRAFAEIQQKNWAEAIRLAEQAVALDPDYHQARFNLGLALYRTAKYQEAKVHLEKAYALNKDQVEPGWFLAQTLEQLGDKKSALTVLEELKRRFPQDPDVAQALSRLLGGAVLWPRPEGANGLYFFGDSMAVLFGGGKPVMVMDAAGKTLWSYTLPGTLVKYVPEDGGGNRVLAVTEGGKLLLIDPDRRVAQAVTGVKFGPDPGGKGGWFHFRGDLLYAGFDYWTGQGPGSKYSYTLWHAYRMSINGEHLAAQPLGEAVMGQQSMEIGRDGKTALLPTPAGQVEVHAEGKRTGALEKRGSLTPKGDAIFRLDGDRLIRVESLEGTPLFETVAPAPFTVLSMLPRTDGFWFVLSGPHDGYAIIQGKEVVSGSSEGRVLGATEKTLIVRVGQEVRVIDLAGKVLATYEGPAGQITPDGKWFYQGATFGIRAYRLPQSG